MNPTLYTDDETGETFAHFGHGLLNELFGDTPYESYLSTLELNIPVRADLRWCSLLIRRALAVMIRDGMETEEGLQEQIESEMQAAVKVGCRAGLRRHFSRSTMLCRKKIGKK